jgi:hypothetical protein
MTSPPYDLEFYEDENGEFPVLRWLKEELSVLKRRALGAAMNEILQRDGPDVARTNFGKALGDGLYEFRLDQDIGQILARVGKKPKRRDQGDAGRILLRVFFHAYGNKIILLLGAYDKGEHTSKNYQQEQIAIARKRLKAWRDTASTTPRKS